MIQNPLHQFLRLWAVGFILCVSLAGAQTLTLATESASYPSLANTVATMTGRSELHLTNAVDPLPGSTVHLNSPDAWLYFSAIKPSQVSVSMLNQVRVNGAPAVLDANVRVVQYEEGTVVIPHSPGFQPMEVFDARNLAGNSKKLGQYINYNDLLLGSMKSTIRSFTLKHGYMATIARNENGTGGSKVYVANDGDLEVSILPAGFENQIRFVRVFPWRWVGKKGICGNIEQNLNVKWLYNWSIDRNSTLDWEYVPIKQSRWWPDLNQDWKSRRATHLLGFNEPDRPDQANMSTDDAIAGWPELESTGLRLGAPAVADPNVGWIDDFMAKANAQGRRVDFVPVHYYRSRANQNDPGGAAWQLQQSLINLHNRVQRPLWVTEWNNGANWSSDPDPTFAQQAEMMRAMSEMLDSLDFVERYSLFNWVEDVRRVVWDDGSLTTAGVIYRDNVSPAAYRQEIPDSGSGPAADYLFENDFRDSSGNGNGVVVHGTPKFVNGRAGTAVSLDGSVDFLQLSPRIGDSTDFTFAAWVKWMGGNNWQRIFDLGSSRTRNLFLTPKSGDNTLRFTIQNDIPEQQLNSTPLTPGVWTHVAVTLSGNTGKLFVNGILVNTNTAMTLNPVDVGSLTNYIGKSQFPDPLFNGQIEEARFFDRALGDSQIASMAAGGVLHFTNHPVTGPQAIPFLQYRATLADQCSQGAGTRRFEKISGPAWLMVAPDGSLSGVPGSSDAGNELFFIRVTDAAGNIDTTELQITVGSNHLVARYAFEGDTESAVGIADAMATGGPSYSAGHQSLGIDLNPSTNSGDWNDYITIPASVVGSREITIASWVRWNGGAAWQRLFDFGNGTGEHVFLTPRSGSDRVLFLTRKDGTESSVETAMLPTNQWTHVAATIGGGMMKLYINGSLAGSSPTTLTPADIAPASNYLGKSQFPDPLFRGRLDEFVIFDRALSPAEISAVKNDTAPAFDSKVIVKPAAIIGQIYEQNVAGSAHDGDPATVLNYAKVSGPEWLNIAANGRLSGVPGLSDAGSGDFIIRVTDPAGLAEEATLKIDVSGATGLIAHFEFDGNSTDSQGGVAGINAGGPTYQQAIFDQAIRLDGTDDHVVLRNDIVSGLNDITIAARVFWNGGSAWQRIFDFGNGTNQYLVLTPRSVSNTLRFTITTNGNAAGAEQQLNAPQLPDGQWSHVAVTLAGDVGTLYVNGIAVSSGSITLNPSSLNPTKNYIGKSQYPDPYFNGMIDDFRIYDHALASGEIRDLAMPPPAVIVPDASYETWADGFDFATGDDLATADPDHDGITNLLEWILGGDPLIASVEILPKGSIKSAAELGLAGNGRYLTLQARVLKNRPGTTLVAEAADNLTNLGDPASATHAISARPAVADGEFEISTWYYDVPVAAMPDGKGFIRLKVIKE